MTFCLWLRCPTCRTRAHVQFYSFPPVKAVVEGNDRCPQCRGEMVPEEPAWVREHRGLAWR